MSATADDRISRAMQDLRRDTPFPFRRSPTRSLADQLTLYATPGVSLAVVDGGKVVWEGSFGVRVAGSSEAVTADTLFQAGSISKPVFATAAMRLVEAGTLDLDENVNTYLTSWQVPANDGWTPRITLRQLLSHTAATSVHGFPGYPAEGPWPTVAQVLNGEPPANTLPVVVEGLPGVAFRYSGGGTTIAQQAVTDVLGRPFPELMRELVLDPAGMRHSTFEQPLRPAGAVRAASGHPWSGVPVPGGWHVYPEMAAAGLWTTAGDLARLGAEVMRILRGRASRLMLRQETAAAMLRPQLAHQRIGQDIAGIGWFCNGDGDAFRFGHGGQDNGFFAHMRMFPGRDAGAVVMINSIQGWPLVEEMLAALGREFGWPTASDSSADVGPTEVDGLIGTYRHADGATVHVARAAEGLTVQFERQEPVPLVARSAHAFVSHAVDLRISFDQGDGPQRRGLALNQSGAELRFDRDDR